MKGTILDKDGYVVYQRECIKTGIGDIFRWHQLYEAKKRHLENLHNNFMGWYDELDQDELSKNIGQYLQRLGAKERQKERDFLQKVFGVDIALEDRIGIIRNLNELIVGKQAYQRALEQLKFARDKLHPKEGEGKRSLASSLSSLYIGKLTSIFGNRINNYVENNIKSQLKRGQTLQNLFETLNWKKISDDVEDLYDASIRDAWYELLQHNQSGVLRDEFGTYWTKDEYDALINATTDEDLKMLEQRIKSRIKIDEIRDVIKTNFFNFQNMKSKKGLIRGGGAAFKRAAKILVEDKKTKQEIESNLRIGQLSGSVNEFLNFMRAKIPDTVVVGDPNKTRKRAAIVHENEVQVTDMTMIYSINSNVTQEAMEAALEDLNQTMLDTSSLDKAAEKMDDFWQEHLSKLDKSYVIFTSNKAYGIGTIEDQGFSAGGKKKIDNLTKFVVGTYNYSGSVKQVEQLIELLKNSINGAYFESERTDYIDAARLVLSEHIANLLFDDWNNIGIFKNSDKAANALHVFILNDIYIPLSILLLAMGKAFTMLKKPRGYLRINFDFPKEILYPEIPIQNAKGKWKSGSNTYPVKDFAGRIKPDTRQAWEKQREDAAKNITFSIRFLTNFYTILKTEIERLT